jgi:DNA-binding protein H-NS
MATLEQLISQREALDAQIAQARDSERKDAVATVRTLIEQFGLAPEDVFGRRSGRPQAVVARPAKYRDPASGATWTGRGKPPGWIRGKDREGFLIG